MKKIVTFMLSCFAVAALFIGGHSFNANVAALAEDNVVQQTIEVSNATFRLSDGKLDDKTLTYNNNGQVKNYTLYYKDGRILCGGGSDNKRLFAGAFIWTADKEITLENCRLSITVNPKKAAASEKNDPVYYAVVKGDVSEGVESKLYSVGGDFWTEKAKLDGQSETVDLSERIGGLYLRKGESVCVLTNSGNNNSNTADEIIVSATIDDKVFNAADVFTYEKNRIESTQTDVDCKGYSVGAMQFKNYEVTTVNERTITFESSDGTKTIRKIAQTDKLTLPEFTATGDSIALGWRNQSDNGLYRMGDEIVVSSDATYKQVEYTFIMNDSVELKIAGSEEGVSGIRFTTNYAEGIESDSSIQELGTLITRAEILAEKEFIVENFEKDVNARMIKATVKLDGANGLKKYSGAIVEIQESNYTKNYCARGYVKVRFADGKEEYFYTQYNSEKNNRNVSALAKAFKDTDGYSKLTDNQKKKVDSYIVEG